LHLDRAWTWSRASLLTVVVSSSAYAVLVLYAHRVCFAYDFTCSCCSSLMDPRQTQRLLTNQTQRLMPPRRRIHYISYHSYFWCFLVLVWTLFAGAVEEYPGPFGQVFCPSPLPVRSAGMQSVLSVGGEGSRICSWFVQRLAYLFR